MTRLLEVEHLVAGYDPGLPIVNAVSMNAQRGELVAILGPNGAGKSTLIKSIAGIVPPGAGRVLLDGVDITRRPAHLLIRQGVAFVPQTGNVFATLSVSDNLKIAAQVLAGGQRAPRIAEVAALFPELMQQQRLQAGQLSGGQRQMLAVARALIVRPRLLLLDEPTAGLSPKVVGELLRKLAEICASGVGVVLVEQNVRAALAIADRVYILVEGRNRLDGATRELTSDPAIAALYLGGSRGRTAADVAAP